MMLFTSVILLIGPIAAAFETAITPPKTNQTFDLIVHPRAPQYNGFKNGIATIYFQNNTQGSCGTTHPDTAMIAALGDAWMNWTYQAPYCSKMIQVINMGPVDTGVRVGGKGNTMTVQVVDTCEACDENHVDFSLAAWNKLTNSAALATVKIAWGFVDAANGPAPKPVQSSGGVLKTRWEFMVMSGMLAILFI